MDKPTLVIISGYFSPLHCGHLDMHRGRRGARRRLAVIVNNNAQQILKKGKLILDEQDRLRDRESAAAWSTTPSIAIDDDGTVEVDRASGSRNTRPSASSSATAAIAIEGAVVPETESVSSTASR